MNDPQKPTDDAKEEIPDQPWTIEAELIADARSISSEEAVNLVIVRYLRSGDTRALAWWLYQGHTLSENARKFIAVMLQPGSKATTEAVPFELAIKTRNPRRGRPKKGPEPSLRDWLQFKFVYSFIQENGPGHYEVAISELSELFGMERATIKRAYENTKKTLALPTEEN